MLGPRIGSKVQDCIKLAKLGEWKKVEEKIIVGDIQLMDGEYELESKVADDDSTFCAKIRHSYREKVENNKIYNVTLIKIGLEEK